MRILAAEKIADSGIEELRKEFEVDVRTGLSPEELKEVIGQYDAIIIRSATQLDAETIERAQNLKIIGRAGIGLDNVDVEAATRKGIIVANAPQSNIISAAEHTLALLLALCRNIPQAYNSLKAGKWERSKFEGVELYGKTLGILGLGKIGTLVAQRAHAFDMEIVAYDPYISKERAAQLNVRMAETLDDLLKEVDFITIHLPRTAETKGMIGAKEIAKMKKGVRIVNTARGGLVDEKALAEAVKSGHVAGAGLDVFEKEPCTDSSLLALDGVMATPHLGASTMEAQDKAGYTIAEQVAAALKGELVSNAVNIAAAGIEDAVKPFLPLAEKIGCLLTHLVEERVGDLELQYAGQISQYDTAILTVAVLKGLFGAVVHEPVTYVNAPILAKERGIEIREVKTPVSRDYINVITVSTGDAQGKRISVGGTLVGKKNQKRFVSIYDFDIDMVPSKYMAFFRYEDRPGMIGKVGTILGNNKINVANMQVGRKVLHGEALMGINVDEPISQKVIEEIKSQAGITDAKFMVL